MEDFEPTVVGLLCNWCAYTGADLAGAYNIEYPANIKIVRVMCSGMVHPNLVIDALSGGIDGVLLCGCHSGECHYRTGNEKAESRAEAIELMLEDFGLEAERFRLEWIAANEAERFANIVREMTETLRELGPNPYKGG